MSAPIDVLAVLDLIIADETQGEFVYPHGRTVMAARAAVAELIEADKEYDKAREAFDTRDPWSRKLSDVSAMSDRLEWAKERRAAALASSQHGESKP